jgi:guanylate kinase
MPLGNGTPIEQSGDAFIADLRARRKPHLFVISGPSGVGKDSVIEHLREPYPDVHFAVTATTRPRRPGEIDGVHYYFMDVESFQQGVDDGDFLEHAVVYGNHYGVPRSPIRHALLRGQDVIVKVDVQGAASIRGIAPTGTFIFLAPESMQELFRRLNGRKSEDPDVVMARFSAASRELLRAHEFDYVVFNEAERMDQAIREIRAIIEAERLRAVQPDVAM